ncbi:MAG: insulinase family protein [Micrococcales bacterium]|nr:insulinase family protein [Micrococcales bacterium]
MGAGRFAASSPVDLWRRTSSDHLLFKGTERRSALDIAAAVESVGGEINAFTTKEYTCYHVRLLDEHLDVAVDVLADMLGQSLLRASDIESERAVVLERSR